LALTPSFAIFAICLCDPLRFAPRFRRCGERGSVPPDGERDATLLISVSTAQRILRDERTECNRSGLPWFRNLAFGTLSQELQGGIG
jgi:hypothetical protein